MGKCFVGHLPQLLPSSGLLGTLVVCQFIHQLLPAPPHPLCPGRICILSSSLASPQAAKMAEVTFRAGPRRGLGLPKGTPHTHMPSSLSSLPGSVGMIQKSRRDCALAQCHSHLTDGELRLRRVGSRAPGDWEGGKRAP